MNFEFKRNIDNLGRILIPVDARRALGIDYCHAVSITVENDRIVIKKIEKEN